MKIITNDQWFVLTTVLRYLDERGNIEALYMLSEYVREHDNLPDGNDFFKMLTRDVNGGVNYVE